MDNVGGDERELGVHAGRADVCPLLEVIGGDGSCAGTVRDLDPEKHALHPVLPATHPANLPMVITLMASELMGGRGRRGSRRKLLKNEEIHIGRLHAGPFPVQHEIKVLKAPNDVELMPLRPASVERFHAEFECPPFLLLGYLYGKTGPNGSVQGVVGGRLRPECIDAFG